MALGIDRHFAWQVWHVRHWDGSGGALGSCGRRLCLRGRCSLWQVWYLVTSIVTLRGRRGTYGTGLALVARLVPGDAARRCVAGVAVGDIIFHFAWQAGHLVAVT